MADAATTSNHRKYYAAGFNAFCQLFSDTSEDVPTFRELERHLARDSGIVFAGWSSTLMAVRPAGAAHAILKSAGHVTFEIQPDSAIQHAFGDHNGCTGGLDDEGNLVLFDNHGLISPLLRSTGGRARPRLSHIAEAGNGHIAIALQGTTAGECSVVEFDSLTHCIDWLDSSESAEGRSSVSVHVVPGTPRQLVAGAATFILLLEDGTVHTWGDPRYQSLGRTIAGEDAAPATRPGLVNALDGLGITKVAVGGWISAALSSDKALYIWGMNMPGSPGVIDILKQPKEEDVSLVEIMEDGIDVLDVLDVSLGDNHVGLIAEGGLLFVSGENSHGQLGLGKADSFIPAWTKVGTMSMLHGVFCGPKATFVW